MKKIIAALVLLAMLFHSVPTIAFAADKNDEHSEYECDGFLNSEIEKILSSYYAEEASRGDSMDKEASRQSIVRQLRELGVEAYCLTKDTYVETEQLLNTNLKDLGLNPGDSCIIYLQPHLENTESNRGVGSWFWYSYGGTYYKLRELVVTANDNPAYSKYAQKNFLTSTSNAVIRNFLEQTVYASLGVAHPALGVAARMCGSLMNAVLASSNVSFTLHGGANWTRYFMQVCDTTYGESWLNGSMVEKVYVLTYLSGMFYNSSANVMQSLSKNEIFKFCYSSRFYNEEWRKSNAVNAYLHNYCEYDHVGDVKIKHNNTVQFTLYENF